MIEVGSVADWVGAVGTAGALLATVHIIISDRKRARSADAAAVSVWWTQRYVDHVDKPASRSIDIHVFNGSSAPLPTVTAYSRVKGRDYIEEVLSAAGADLAAIEPGMTVVRNISVVHHVDVDRVYVFFITRDGKRWARCLGDGRLMPGAKAKHLAEGAGRMRAALARTYPRDLILE
ncbi:hypothetical protein FRIG_03630 [Frigoribacterium faeni]|uniref:hypothetical protein n=1 Tax=Frigoribacterium faeni TaxID=145483 RepID=UPI001FAD392E|nr:hypothetical protein [Frigoribacterium faeni]MCJ0700232.1 hypothetical protein [Frigoribacterium faeni]